MHNVDEKEGKTEPPLAARDTKVKVQQPDAHQGMHGSVRLIHATERDNLLPKKRLGDFLMTLSLLSCSLPHSLSSLALTVLSSACTVSVVPSHYVRYSLYQGTV